MYTVYADGHLLYHPELANNGYGIYNPTINYEANKSGSFQFKMPVTNVMYNSLTKMSSIITVYQDSEEIFRGRVLNDSRDYYNNKSVYVEGELAFLLDSIVRPVEWNGTIANLFAHIINSHNEQVDVSKRFTVGNCTVLADNEVTYSITDYSNSWNVLNSYLLDIYGGYIRVRLENGTRYIDYIASYNSTSDQVIRFGDNLLDFNQHISGENVITRLIPLGAAYEIEKEDSEITPGTKIIDYESEPVGNKKKDNARTYIFAMEVLINSKNKSTEKTNVTVNFKVKTEANTISWSGQSASKLYAVIKTKTDKKTTERKKTGLASANWSTNYTTICTWTGDLKTGQTTITCEFVNNYSTKDNKPVSCGMSRYVDLLQQKSTRVDITSVNDGKDYIVNSQAEALFGQITGVQVWDDTDDPTALKTKGEEYLSENIALNVTLDVNAVDLNLVNVNYEKFKIGDRIRVVSAPHVLDEYFTCTAMGIDLQNPEQNSYTLGAEYKTLTETQIVNTNKLALTDEQINDIWEAVDEMQSIAEEANELIQTIYDNYADITTVIENLDATYADIDFANISTAAIENLLATNAFIQALNAKYAQIDWANIDFAEIDSAKIQELLATNAAIQTLSAAYAEIDLANVDMANIAQATIQSLFANAAFIQELQTRYAKIDFANIGTAAIENLTTNHLNSIYADVDFAHITEAAIQRLFAGTGLVNNLVIEEGHVTGTLAGVRITGDVIDANTIKADSLILQGDDGVYYKLNIDGLNNISTSEAAKFTLLTAKPADWETNWKDYYQITNNEYVHLTSNTAPTWAANRYYKLSSLYESGLDGSNIVARSLTANQIAAGTITASELNISSAKSGLGINDLETTVSGTVNSIAITYAYGDSTSTHPADSAFTYSDMPARVDGSYIWRKTVTSYVNGNSVTKYEMIQGVDGQDGQQGPQGNPGTSAYTHIRYSANSNGNPMSTTPNTYIGIYTGTSSTAPTSYTSYTWSKFQGTDGTSYYVWLRYSANSDGSNMTTSPTSTTKYIGVYSGTSSTAPTSASSYTWSKYIGEDGKSVTISSKEVAYAKSDQGSSAPSSGWSTTFPTNLTNGDYLWTRTTVTYSSGGSTVSYSVSYIGTNGTSPTAYDLRCSVYSVTKDTNNSDALSPTSVTFSSYSQTGNGTWGAYSGRFKIYTTTNNSTWTAVYTSSSNQSSYAYTVPSGIVGIKCELYLAGGTSTLVDSQTVPIISIGKNGTDGQDGEDGKDAYTVILTNESHTFAATSNGKAIAGNTQVNVIAYKGTTQVAATIGTITGLPTGMTAPITSNGTTSAYFTPTVTTSMVTKTGVLTVPITVDGKSFTKKFSYSLAVAGTGISSIAYYYATTTTQTQPAASAITSTTIPVLSPTNKYLWQKEVITYTSGNPTTNVTLIGVYGDTGVGVQSMFPLYYMADGMLDMELQGNTKQTGKNLVDVHNIGTLYANTASYTSTGGIKLTISNAGTYRYSSIRLSNGLLGKTVTFSTTISVSGTAEARVQFFWLAANGYSVSGGAIGSAITGTGSKTVTLTIPSTLASGAACPGILFYTAVATRGEAGASVTYDKVQLELGSTATAYEPYFGTIPSPDYPVPVHSVSGDNTVTVCGKNLANFVDGEASPKTQYGVTFTRNSDGTISVSGTATNLASFQLGYTYIGGITGNITVSGLENSTNIVWNIVRLYEEDRTTQLYYVALGNRQPFTINLADYPTAKWLVLQVKRGNNVATSGVIQPQIEVGSTATDYQPYQSQVFPITLPVENLFNKNDGESNKNFNASGEVIFGTHFISNYISVLPNTQYYLSNVLDAYNGRTAFVYDSNKANPRVIALSGTRDTSGVFTTGSAEVYVRVCTDTPDICQLERGSKANTYQPYINLINISQEYNSAQFSLSGTTLTNTVTDTRTDFRLQVQLFNGSTAVRAVVSEIVPTGYFNRTINFGDLSNITRFCIKSNGSSRDLILCWVPIDGFEANTDYILSMDIIGINPSVAGGLVVSNLRITKPTISIELNKIGSYADYFHQQDGSWYLHKEVKKITYDNSNYYANKNSSDTSNYLYYIAARDSSNVLKSSQTGVGYCDQLVAVNNLTTLGTAVGFSPTRNYDVIYLGLAGLISSNDTDTARAWLGEKAPTFYFSMYTPQEYEVTDTTLLGQLNAISQAMSYNGTTNILQDNNDLPFNIIYNEQAGIAPDAPTPPVTSTTNAPDVWTKFTPAHIDGYRYYTCLQTKYDNNTYSISDVVPDQELNEVHAQLKYIETQVTENHSLFEVLDDRITSQVSEITTVKGQVEDMNGTISETEKTLREEISSSVEQSARDITTSFNTTIARIDGDIDSIETVTTYFKKSSNGLLIGKTDSDIRMQLDNDSLDFLNKNDEVMAKLDANEGLIAAKLAVGSPTEGDKRWQFTPWGDGNTHMRIAKHK